ncbi:hypothetical protein DEO72_LG8g1917 [Vigna unguiculata]|uniref:Uncharacterized protein n=1 Tax=Vigna unguiculata TaxID=3917 RepID=A0A4D6MS33_VIGUN|nr:hypothetical protein DEO72_LG8g1917 [Vigna unguiculata]
MSTPSMNLPAHGTASPDPSKASLSVKTTHTTRGLVHDRLAHQPTPPGETGPDRLAVPAHRQAPALFQRHCFSRNHLAEHSLAARRHAVQESFPVIPIAWRYQQTARRHTSNFLLLIWHPKL